jgi:hypothetical protein
LLTKLGLFLFPDLAQRVGQVVKRWLQGLPGGLFRGHARLRLGNRSFYEVFARLF